MFERFTDRARRVVVLAQEEARTLNHDYMAPSTCCWPDPGGRGRGGQGAGVAGDQPGGGAAAGRGDHRPGQQPPSGHIPFTPRAKKVLELSLREETSSATTTSAPSTSCWA